MDLTHNIGSASYNMYLVSANIWPGCVTVGLEKKRALKGPKAVNLALRSINVKTPRKALNQGLKCFLSFFLISVARYFEL